MTVRNVERFGQAHGRRDFTTEAETRPPFGLTLCLCGETIVEDDKQKAAFVGRWVRRKPPRGVSGTEAALGLA